MPGQILWFSYATLWVKQDRRANPVKKSGFVQNISPVAYLAGFSLQWQTVNSIGNQNQTMVNISMLNPWVLSGT